MNADQQDRLSTSPRDTLSDRRTPPRGVLPRHIQTWVMLALAAAMLLVIVVTGRSTAPRRTPEAAGSPAAASTLPPDRLRKYQEQLAQQEARLRQELADAQSAAAPASASAPQREVTTPEPKPADPIADERRRREYASVFADTVAFTRRSGGTTPPASTTTTAVAPSPAAVIASPAAAPATPQAAAPPPPPSRLGLMRLLEGTAIEAVLTNRLEGSFQNPVNALVTTPVYAADGQVVVIPAGARVLGSASPVQALGETRLAVKFHRLVMPDGTTHDLDQLPALNERGDAGLKDQVDRHYLQLFGASIALGALSGLAQYSTRSSSESGYGFSDAFGQGVGGSVAASSGRILDRFLNVLPNVTIREGHRLRIYLTRDLELPPYPDPSVR